MREIKFRAWIFGGLDDDAKPFMEPISQIGWDGLGMDWIKWTTHDEYSIPGKECVLMQFTGLLDKNGTEIYEGDVVRWPHLSISGGEVYFNTEEACFVVSHRQHDDESWLDKGCEVIGNVHENPELLKKEG